MSNKKAVAVHKNMERLRALREAREAQETDARAVVSDTPKKKRTKVLSK
jgi:hypothetical protein